MALTYPISQAHTLTEQQVKDTLQTDVLSGISTKEASTRNTHFGLNSYKQKKQKSVWIILLEQFTNPIVYLLVFGAAVSVYFEDVAEAIAILLVILVNALISFLMEIQARRSMDALRQMDVITTKVIRDGKMQEIPSELLCPGDLVFFEAGDVIPGDALLVESNQLQCDESSLTGESLPADKTTSPVAADAPLAEQHNMVFKGTAVVKGNGKAIVTGIALDTELGKITSLVESSEKSSTPLDKKLNDLTYKLIWLTGIVMAAFAISGFIQGKAFVLIIQTSIALAVAAIPEGLPIVATVALAHGMLLMSRKNVIVKKLSSVETLGGTNVILTDKTGTLTENKIHVNTLAFPEEKLEVKLEETVLFVSGEIQESQENYQRILIVGALCNNADVTDEKKETGDPIEISLIHLANGTEQKSAEIKTQYKRLGEVPFDSDTKVMGTLHESENGLRVAAKGSVEHLLAYCNTALVKGQSQALTDETQKHILAESEKMAENGLRVLAFADRVEKEISQSDFMKDLEYVGMIGFLDPPRLDIKPAILACKQAGIKVVMITGDHPKTALNIAEQTGLADVENNTVLTGGDLPNTSDFSVEWKNKILSATVFARATPKQKLDIADLYQKEGNIVAMTGDGINDAPALKKADVGIAMGLRGTQVAKETADIVLKDDSFTSIAEAVARGREIFQNIQKFVVYLISCNLSEIFIVTALGFIAPAATLLPLQILFLNMITDVFPALALGMGKGDNTVMKRPPRDPKQGILLQKDWIKISLYAGAMTLSVVLGVLYCQEFLHTDTKTLNTIAFLSLAFAQLLHVFNMASDKKRVLKNEITTNSYVWYALVLCLGITSLFYFVSPLHNALDMQLLDQKAWLACAAISFFPLLIIQVVSFAMAHIKTQKGLNIAKD
jgi:P-type Ca2+ transporter type 2C